MHCIRNTTINVWYLKWQPEKLTFSELAVTKLDKRAYSELNVPLPDMNNVIGDIYHSYIYLTSVAPKNYHVRPIN